MPLDKRRIRALCFDVDGTLRDTDDQYVAQLARWLNPLRFLFAHKDPRRFARRAVMALESPATALYSLPDRLGIENRLDSFVERMHHVELSQQPEVFWIIPQASETVKALAQHYPLAIISARHERPTLSFLKHYDLAQYFKCIATAHTCMHTKPFPDPVLWAARQMDVPPSACLMIGDTTVDIHAGKAAGAQTVGVLCGFGEVRELRLAGADEIVASIADLPALLHGWIDQESARCCAQPASSVSV